MEESKNIKNRIIDSLGDEKAQRFQKLSKEFAKIMSYYKSAMLEVDTRFHALNEEYLFEHQ